MGDTSTLGRAFEAVADALARTDGGDSCVAVWPATAGGFVGELQVLTEREWRRMLRVGLRLAPISEDVTDIYCFENDMVHGGLVVSSMRLVQESQTTRRGDLQVWKVLKTPRVVRRRVDVLAEIESGERAGLGGNSAVDSTSDRSTKVDLAKSISSEEAQRKRHNEDDTADLHVVAGSKCTTDEIRPPTQTRRLSGKKRERSAAVAPVSLAGGRYQNASGSIILDRNSRLSKRPKLSRSSCETEEIQAGFAAVASSNNPSELSSGDLADESSTASSDGEQSELDGVEQDPPRPHLLTCQEMEGDSDSSSQNLDDEHVKFVSVLKQVAAAGLGTDDDDSGVGQSNCSTSLSLEGAVSLSSSIGETLQPFWSIFENATIRAQRVLREYCGMFSVPGAITAQDALDYDLRWIEEVEEDNHLRWTMFGEPSTPAGVGVRTRYQQRKQKRARSKWKFW